VAWEIDKLFVRTSSKNTLAIGTETFASDIDIVDSASVKFMIYKLCASLAISAPLELLLHLTSIHYGIPPRECPSSRELLTSPTITSI
jgi:hypothetical protein